MSQVGGGGGGAVGKSLPSEEASLSFLLCIGSSFKTWCRLSKKGKVRLGEGGKHRQYCLSEMRFFF